MNDIHYPIILSNNSIRYTDTSLTDYVRVRDKSLRAADVARDVVSYRYYGYSCSNHGYQRR